jgi:hypothetical protein
MKTYELFEGEELNIAEKIQQRRLQILVHSCIYYEYNKNIISDRQFDIWGKELVQLQKDYPDIASQIIYADAFEGFDASTGFDLPIRDEWVMKKASKLCGLKTKTEQKQEIRKKGRLF